MTLDRSTEVSAEQVSDDEHDVTDGGGHFRPRRPNVRPVPAQPVTRPVVEPAVPATEPAVPSGGPAVPSGEWAVPATGPSAPVGEPAPGPPAAAGGTTKPILILAIDGSPRPVAPVQAPARRGRDALAVGLAIATFLALVASAIWFGADLASRVAGPAGGGRLPAAVPPAGNGSAPPVPSVPVTVAPSTPAPVTSRPAAATPTRSRTTTPPARVVRATVTVVNDRGGEFQLAVVVNNTSSVAQTWEVVITFPVRVTRLRAVGNGTLTARSNQAIVRGTSGPGETGLAIGGVTSNGNDLRTWTCTVNGQPC